MNKIGYIYIWWDTLLGWYYVGGHVGKPEDSYVSSSKTMMAAYSKRPETFRFRVLEFVEGDTQDVRAAEQKWLDKIDSHELLTSTNVREGTVRYYNVKRSSAGGNGHANRGNSNIGGHNRKKWLVEKPDRTKIIVESSYKFSRSLGKRWSNLYAAYRNSTAGPKRGEWKGWRMIKEIKE